jgi:CRISPR-associated endonuclease Csn1
MLERAAFMPKAKAKRFAPDGYEQWLKDDKDFLARALNDTAYFSRIAKEYLSLVCPPNKVRAIPGRMTALLRGKFGLDSLLSGSGIKNRNDHRHHAIDASVIAVTDQGLLQKFANASKSASEKRLGRLVEDMPLPWSTFRDHVERAVSNIIVSHKPDHGFEGSLFKDTAYGITRDGTVVQKKRKDEASKERVIEYVVPIADPTQQERHGLASNGGPRPYKGYQPDGNYCLEIIETEVGDWAMETIPTFVAYRRAREINRGRITRQEVVDKLINDKLSEKPGGLVMKLMPGDVIRMDYKGVPNRLLSVVKMSVQGGATFTELNEANVSGRYESRRKARLRLKSGDLVGQLSPDEQAALYDEFVLSQIGVAELKAGRARRVTISPIGDLHDPGFKE